MDYSEWPVFVCALYMNTCGAFLVCFRGISSLVRDWGYTLSRPGLSSGTASFTIIFILVMTFSLAVCVCVCVCVLMHECPPCLLYYVCCSVSPFDRSLDIIIHTHTCTWHCKFSAVLVNTLCSSYMWLLNTQHVHVPCFRSVSFTCTERVYA